MTEHDILKTRFKPDGLAIGDFNLDVIRYVEIPKVQGEDGHAYRGGFTGEGSIWKDEL